MAIQLNLEMRGLLAVRAAPPLHNFP